MGTSVAIDTRGGMVGNLPLDIEIGKSSHIRRWSRKYRPLNHIASTRRRSALSVEGLAPFQNKQSQLGKSLSHPKSRLRQIKGHGIPTQPGSPPKSYRPQDPRFSVWCFHAQHMVAPHIDFQTAVNRRFIFIYFCFITGNGNLKVTNGLQASFPCPSMGALHGSPRLAGPSDLLELDSQGSKVNDKNAPGLIQDSSHWNLAARMILCR
ncbi:uncharacterized protein VTP21DRAFT_11638 [Calcarisporiella thermophila]|uniref:uncharacterized protein n=1 Tax=Calcarisporiella thermophila TaxID=911321 RepID=UPI0037440E2F